MLSHFDKCLIQFEGTDFVSSEHEYQWSACVEDLSEDLAEEVMKAKTPSEAKCMASAASCKPCLLYLAYYQ